MANTHPCDPEHFDLDDHIEPAPPEVQAAVFALVSDRQLIIQRYQDLADFIKERRRRGD